MAWDPANLEVTFVDTIDDLLDMRAWMSERREWLGMDCETSGLNLGRDRIRLWQIGDANRGWAVPWDWWSGALRELVPEYEGRIAFHNAPFDLGFAERDGLKIPQRQTHCTMVMAHLIDPRRAIGLKPAGARHVDRSAWMGKNALSEAMKAGGWDWATIPIDHPSYWIYAAMDTCLTAALAEKLHPQIEPYSEIYETEMACIFTLRNARLAGVMTDLDYVVETRARLIADCEGLRGRIPVDPGKDDQVKALLEGLGRENGYGMNLESWWPFRTEKGAVSLDDEALTAFEDHFPTIVPPLKEWRKKSRIVSAYLNNILKMNVDGVLRCNIKEVGARTGRMSITEPALQTLPRGRLVRDGFVPREGCKLLLADYEQMEARMLASDANCGPMLEMFEREEDLHTMSAALCYHMGADDVPPLKRQIAKNVGYARMYGAGARKIAATAKVPLEEIEDFMQRYEQQFPEVNEYMAGVVSTVRRRLHEEGDGYVTTVLGRRLPVDDDKPYKGINFRIQGSGGDVLKRKLVELDHAGLGPYIRLPVHDEIVSEVPDDLVPDALELLNRVMPERTLFRCPLTIETDVVTKWGMHYTENPDERGHWNDGVWTPPLR